VRSRVSSQGCCAFIYVHLLVRRAIDKEKYGLYMQLAKIDIPSKFSSAQGLSLRRITAHGAENSVISLPVAHFAVLAILHQSAASPIGPRKVVGMVN